MQKLQKFRQKFRQIGQIRQCFQISDKIPGFSKTIELCLNFCMGFCIT